MSLGVSEIEATSLLLRDRESGVTRMSGGTMRQCGRTLKVRARTAAAGALTGGSPRRPAPAAVDNAFRLQSAGHIDGGNGNKGGWCC